MYRALTALYADQIITDNDALPVKTRMPKRRRLLRKLQKNFTAMGLSPPEFDPPRTWSKRSREWLMGDGREEWNQFGVGALEATGGVHIVGKSGLLLFDMDNCNFLEEAINEAGFAFQPKNRYLDFGCSTGRSVRTMDLAFDRSIFHGVDPIPSSIAFAKNNLPGIEFTVSNQDPPLPYDDGFFHGLYAKSVWTHFSAAAGRRWLEEMARIVSPGGFLAITMHGPHDLSRRVVFNDPCPNYQYLEGIDGDAEQALSTISNAVISEKFFFAPYRTIKTQSDLRHLETANTSEWGLTFITREWVEDHWTVPGLKLVHVAHARTGSRQDVYIFRKD